ncbi:trans-Golgi network integral membrane protein TGN38-like [Uranotaenia lowii]|uniref:trans-Golgi network integral membrane protein TGN38-like n=1 Tax=Uranotaenia lowii TaxID=190385 RepID=UPI0024789324|nr:trans-Golgi network integral membrane protein TGN38-like [Uranotaenia lowii]
MAKPVHLEMANLQRSSICSLRCSEEIGSVDDPQVVVKPLCQVLLWGYRQLLLHQTEQKLTVEQKAANVVIPPALAPIAKVETGSEKNGDRLTETKVQESAIKSIPETPHEDLDNNKDKADDTKKKTTTTSIVMGQQEPQAVNPLENETGEAAKGQQEPQAVNPIENETGDPAKDDLEEQNKKNINEIDGDVNLLDSEKEPGNEKAVGDENLDDSGMNFNMDDSDEDDQDLAVEKNSSPVVESRQEAPEQPSGKEDGRISLEQDSAERHQEDIRSEQLKDPFFEDPDSNFFSYFMFAMFACVVCYVGYHNKSKLLALVLEGRRSNGTSRGGFSKNGRKHTAAYRKLDSNLEEAITSNSAGSNRSTTQIIY